MKTYRSRSTSAVVLALSLCLCACAGASGSANADAARPSSPTAAPSEPADRPAWTRRCESVHEDNGKYTLQAVGMVDSTMKNEKLRQSTAENRATGKLRGLFDIFIDAVLHDGFDDRTTAMQPDPAARDHEEYVTENLRRFFGTAFSSYTIPRQVTIDGFAYAGAEIEVDNVIAAIEQSKEASPTVKEGIRKKAIATAEQLKSELERTEDAGCARR